MGFYTLLMAAAAVAAMALNPREWINVLIACVPFIAVPGLSDAKYLPVAQNDPWFLGLFALVVGTYFAQLNQHPWHLLVGVVFAVMVGANAAHLLGGTSAGVHAVAQEAFFYTAIAIITFSRWLRVDDFPGPLASVGAAIKEFQAWARVIF